MAFDDFSVKVSPVPKRTVGFEVTKDEAAQVSKDLERILQIDEVKGTGGVSSLRRIWAAFSAVANDREFGGH